MKLLLVFGAVLAVASALSLNDNDDNNLNMISDKDDLNNLDMKMKQKLIMKLMNNILQLTVYKDIEDIARNYDIENNVDKYTKIEVIKDFCKLYKKVGLLPRGEIFVLNNQRHMYEVIKAFHVLFFAKDFDCFYKTACWMRQRLNEGMFVYALTVACIHREDCRGMVLPAPYEIYPFYFVNSDVIQKAYMIKMKNGRLDQRLLDYYNIKVTDKNVCIIESMRDINTVMHTDDKLKYFTQDIDLNTYYYYFHMDYPMWMGQDVFGTNKERRGELYYYFNQQLIARYNLERLSSQKCDVKMLNWDMPLKTGYWPKLRLHNGMEMPVRNNDYEIKNEDNVHIQRLVDDYERRIRDAIFKGYIETRDGTRFEIKKPEDIEILGRLMQGNLDKDDVKFFHYLNVFMKALLLPNNNKHSIVTPNALDQYETCLRDHVCWQLQMRLVDNFLVFKKLLVPYTRDELDFPGVKIENIQVDKLVTFFDNLDIDITNAVLMNDEEIKKQKTDMLFVMRDRCLNHQNFKINMDVVSDKTVDCVVRIFIGPKYDCRMKLLNLNEKRFNFVEIDSFLYNLKTGKNNIVRDSKDMHNALNERIWSRKLLDSKLMGDMLGGDINVNVDEISGNKQRIGFPNRLLLPKGTSGGMDLQMYFIISPVRSGKTLNMVDQDSMKIYKNCRYTVCIDSMPLGYPFDRLIDNAVFMTNNMMFYDVKVFHRDLDGQSMKMSQRMQYHLGFNYGDRMMSDIKPIDNRSMKMDSMDRQDDVLLKKNRMYDF